MTGNASTHAVGTEAAGRSEPRSPTPMGGASVSEVLAADFRPAAGHCDDPKAWAEFVRQYDGKPRSMPGVTDFALANRVFMASRGDLDLILWQTAAKERIRWLSIELAKAQHALARQASNPTAEGGE